MTKQTRITSMVLAAVLLFSGLSGSSLSPAAEGPERVSSAGAYGTLSVEVPAGWSCSELDEEEGLSFEYGLRLTPDAAGGSISLGFIQSFGVCGTGLAEEEKQLAGREAIIGTYDGREIWDFVKFTLEEEGLPDLVAIAAETESWTVETAEEGLAILDTLIFQREPVPAESETFAMETAAAWEAGLLEELLGSVVPTGKAASLQMRSGGEMSLEAAAEYDAWSGYEPVLTEWNTEEYDTITEHSFVDVRTSPLSTFSVDVDTAAYANFRRMVKEGTEPARIPSGTLRTEEFINYFHYDYALPEEGKKFGVLAEMAPCPWNRENVLLRIGLKATENSRLAEGRSNLVFLVDISGSMASSDKLELLKKALLELLENLKEEDTVSLVTYAAGEHVLFSGAHVGEQRETIAAAINSLEASGSTNGERGLKMAYEIARENYAEGGNNRIIMCSDGDLNVGITSTSELHDFVSEKAQEGVYLSIIGFGAGNYKDNKMETLADDGNGNYYYIDSMLEARKVFSEELTRTLYTVADDVKCQIEFNPAKVAAYRQIGYENRALADSDFQDDTKDAGEVGAGQTITVLYELTLADAGSGEGGGLKYQTSEPTEAGLGDEFLTLGIRYKEPGESESRLEEYPLDSSILTETPGDDFTLAAAVAELCMVLRGSPYTGDAGITDVREMLLGIDLNDVYKEELLYLVTQLR